MTDTNIGGSTPPQGLRVAILQSNYVPWRGYFDIIHDVDLFVFYDDVQYTRRDWRNRNRIKTPHGSQWLTVPTDGSRDTRIHEVRLVDPDWQRVHWDTFRAFYARAPYFQHYRPFFEHYYLARSWTHLSEFNQAITRAIAAELLGIEASFADSRDYDARGAKRERIMDLLKRTGAQSYVSGPSAKDYLDEREFADLGVELCWKDYSGYPDYPQFFPPFDPYVSILDLLFHAGPQAPWFVWGWRGGAAPLSSAPNRSAGDAPIPGRATPADGG